MKMTRMIGFGAAIAAGVAVWRSEGARRELRGPGNETLGERLARFEERQAHFEKTQEHQARAQEQQNEQHARAQEQQNKTLRSIERSMVTDEEFGAYTMTTTETIRGLTAEISKAIGQLEGAKR